MRRLIPVALALTAGCATAPLPRIPVEEVFGQAPAQSLTATEAWGSASLERALERFKERVRASRQFVRRGAPMDDVHAQAWTDVLDALQGSLSGKPGKSAALDVMRARLLLETELNLDGQTYGDFPPRVAERARVTLNKLSARLQELTGIKPRQRVATSFFSWPIDPVVVTSGFGNRMHPVKGDWKFHAGVDLMAAPQQVVTAPFSGTVVFAGWYGAYGNCVELQHDAVLSTRYGHLMKLLVENGAHVNKGEPIGLAGDTGQTTGVHLHFELLKEGKPTDPLEQMPAPHGGPVAMQ